MGLTRTVEPATYPVTLAEAKVQCRIEDDDATDDSFLNAAIYAATDYVEYYLGRSIMAQTWALKFDDFTQVAVNPLVPWGLTNTLNQVYLPRGPVSAVSSITYYDAAGVSQTLSTDVYEVDTSSDPQRVVLADGQSWPTPKVMTNAVTITYTAGYSAVPKSIKQAILLIISQWMDNRTSLAGQRQTLTPAGDITELPHTVVAMLSNHRSFAAAS